jgi:fibronectin-binding autotransporter adhesin
MRRFAFILTLFAVTATFTAGPALGAAKGTDRPLRGTSTSTTTVNLSAGTGAVAGSGQLSHLGKFDFTNDITSFAVTGPDTFTLTLTAVIVAANGDEIHTTATGTGTLTPTGSESTLVSTAVGGTGRFADASGTTISRITSVVVSQVGSTITSRDSEVHEGRVSY